MYSCVPSTRRDKRYNEYNASRCEKLHNTDLTVEKPFVVGVKHCKFLETSYFLVLCRSMSDYLTNNSSFSAQVENVLVQYESNFLHQTQKRTHK